MARSLSQFQTLLEGVMEAGGGNSENVFLVPPTVLPNPCMKYNQDSTRVFYADNLKLVTFKRYQVTVIDRDVDSLLPDLVETLPHSSFDRWYAANGVNHWVYNIFF